MSMDKTIKIVAFLSPEAFMALEEICILASTGKPRRRITKSLAICDAVIQFYKNELNKQIENI